MTAWPKDELRKIAEAYDLHISPFREDGLTYGTPTWIWSVAVDDALYVRAYNGRRNDEGSCLRTGQRVDQRSHRRHLSIEVPRQLLPETDGRRPRPFRDGQGHAARNQSIERPRSPSVPRAREATCRRKGLPSAVALVDLRDHRACFAGDSSLANSKTAQRRGSGRRTCVGTANGGVYRLRRRRALVGVLLV